MISCGCGDDYDFYYTPAGDFSKLETKRRRRCVSCGELIDLGSLCLDFYCYRRPRCDYEDERFGDEVPMATKYMCEKCGEIFLNLRAYGYCIALDGDIREDLKTHWDITGFEPESAAKQEAR